MPRPKTKGDNIQIRLPLSADAELRRRAENAGMTAGEWLEAKIIPQLVPPVYSEPVGRRHDDDVPTNFKKS